MTMSFFLNGDMGDFESADFNETVGRPNRSLLTKQDDLPLVTEKLRIPTCVDIVHRPRLHELLERSRGQFGGTLISGRSGTGKTALAAEFVAGKNKVAWYSVDPSDADWSVFARYFSAATGGKRAKKSVPDGRDRAALGQFLGDCLSAGKNGGRLVVLDNIHHLFDADWFCDFFVLMLQSLDPESHALMLCRSKPPAPLWRLRSKQVLNVVDERLLAFTSAEAEELCKLRGIPKTAARAFQSESFGRASKLMQFINGGKSSVPIH